MIMSFFSPPSLAIGDMTVSTGKDFKVPLVFIMFSRNCHITTDKRENHVYWKLSHHLLSLSCSWEIKRNVTSITGDTSIMGGERRGLPSLTGVERRGGKCHTGVGYD